MATLEEVNGLIQTTNNTIKYSALTDQARTLGEKYLRTQLTKIGIKDGQLVAGFKTLGCEIDDSDEKATIIGTSIMVTKAAYPGISRDALGDTQLTRAAKLPTFEDEQDVEGPAKKTDFSIDTNTSALKLSNWAGEFLGAGGGNRYFKHRYVNSGSLEGAIKTARSIGLEPNGEQAITRQVSPLANNSI